MADETALTVQRPGVTGMALTFSNADATNGNKFTNDGHTYFEAVEGNGEGTAIITIATPKTVEGLAVDNVAVTLTNGERVIMGPFTPDVFNDQSGTDVNCVTMAFTGANAADVDIAVFQ